MKQAGAGIEPIFPQQSIREMMRTSRSANEVMHDALSGMQQAGWNGKTGADADHLKTTDDVDVTFEAGFTFFTIDPSDHVDAKADDYDESTLRNNFSSVAERVSWRDEYVGRKIELPTGTRVELTEEACMRAAVKYGLALNEALKISEYINQVHQQTGRDYEIELSVDETEQTHHSCRTLHHRRPVSSTRNETCQPGASLHWRF